MGSWPTNMRLAQGRHAPSKPRPGQKRHLQSCPKYLPKPLLPRSSTSQKPCLRLDKHSRQSQNLRARKKSTFLKSGRAICRSRLLRKLPAARRLQYHPRLPTRHTNRNRLWRRSKRFDFIFLKDSLIRRKPFFTVWKTLILVTRNSLFSVARLKSQTRNLFLRSQFLKSPLKKGISLHNALSGLPFRLTILLTTMN